MIKLLKRLSCKHDYVKLRNKVTESNKHVLIWSTVEYACNKKICVDGRNIPFEKRVG